jgi:cyanophycinase-like exopeptidase
MKKQLLLFAAVTSLTASAQNYDSYFTGNSTDVSTSPQGGVCLMGGATEEDEAMKWFLNRADGGDVLVLRASGADGYNDYMYSQLGVTVNSVETIVFNDASASSEVYIQQKIAQAEAIWFAGGDQWNYITYWQGNAIESAINQAIGNGAVVGGTSAGMAILGGYRFTAENGTVTSPTALANPYDNNVTIGSNPFIASGSYLENTITDTHYDNPDRKGRHVTFLARILQDSGITAKGIACDEYTAVCIDENGMARVYGQYPTYDDNAYFILPNCELTNPSPETCTAGSPLTWNHNGAAVKVYTVKGALAGTNTFDLSDWQTGVGGEWQDWSVVNGVLNEAPGVAPECSASIEETDVSVYVYPNPTQSHFHIEGEVTHVNLMDGNGRTVQTWEAQPSYQISSSLASGVYTIKVQSEHSIGLARIIVE